MYVVKKRGGFFFFLLFSSTYVVKGTSQILHKSIFIIIINYYLYRKSPSGFGYTPKNAKTDLFQKDTNAHKRQMIF